MAAQASISDFVLSLPKAVRRDPPMPFDVLLTSYELALLDADFLSRCRWRVVVVDEAHRLKNHKSALYEALQHQYATEYKLLLTVENEARCFPFFPSPSPLPPDVTFMRPQVVLFILLTIHTQGTPCQNNVGELWALLHFLHPDVVDDIKVRSGV